MRFWTGGIFILELNHLYNMDCMEGMKQFPDKYFDLAVVDPPYGIDKAFHVTSRIRKYGQTNTANDDKPKAEYFEELFRISKNQIVFGYNHISDMLPPTKEFIFWYKHQPVKSYSDGELAWTSFHKTAKCFDFPFFGSINAEENRFHPMQKPVKLYEWILSNYAKPVDKILDTHVGSASSLVACENLGFQYIGFEIDRDYYRLAYDRLEAVKAQTRLF